MQNFRELRVWNMAHELTLAAYEITRDFPKSELYGLTSQIRRSAASVCANIAEGCGRGSRRDFAMLLQIARGSASELEYHLILAADPRLVDRPTHASCAQQVTDVKRMLTGLIRRLGSARAPDHDRSSGS